MQVNIVSAPAFGANVSRFLHDELFKEARSKSSKTAYDYLDHLHKLDEWGLKSTDVVTLTKKTKNGKETSLGLINNVLAPFRQVSLPKRGNLFDSFMTLTKNDIEQAESRLTI